MFVKVVKQRNGTHFLQLVEGYKLSGKTKHRTIKSLGVLENLQKNNPNILAELKEKYRDETLQKQEKDNQKISLKDITRYDDINYGYFLAQAIYENIGIDKFLNNNQKEKKLKIKYSLDDDMKLLVFSRILNPDSKLATFENKDFFFDKFDIDLNDIYRSLNIFDNLKDGLQLDMHKNITEKYGRDLTLVFYDVTNYYFETHQNDEDIVDDSGEVDKGFRRKGFGKDGKKQPLVVMGLIIDKNSIPVAYRLFEGNTSDTTTLQPVLNELKDKYNLGKIIVVADKGLNSKENIGYIAGDGNGYIVSQRVKGMSKEFIDTTLDETGYVYNENKTWKSKSITAERKLKNAKGETIVVNEKTVFFWSKEYYDRKQYTRNEDKRKILNFIKNQDVLPKLDKGLKEYITETVVDIDGKEIKGAKVKYSFNETKFNEDSKLDGYYSIITSEKDLTDKEVIEKYRGLTKIEDSFRILKSDLDGRPVNVWTKPRIEGHFLICFIALTIMRILQKLTIHDVVIKEKGKEKIVKKEFSVEKLQEAMNSAKMHSITNAYLNFANTNETFKEIEKIFNANNNFDTIEIEKFNVYKNQLLYNIKTARFH